MTRLGVMPHDDRAWPRSSASVSVVIVLCAVGTGVGLVAAVVSRGGPAIVLVAAVALLSASPARRDFIRSRME